ncbi:MAG: WbqC family protein [Flavobacterium sp.]|jgi:hypothetical protein|uniref:WbqC family protein n=1 Tax=Flavobacterium sp. TaxID=239 RepID=UPI003BC740C6
MKVAIMQPYFLPYIGYFQLINAVDVFVVYDNVEYTKKGWINRNRILVNGKDEFITLPLKKDSDFLHINQRFLADSNKQDKEKMLRKIKECYRKAPNYQEAFALTEEIFSFNSANLFEFVFNSIKVVCDYLEIKTKFTLSSTINIDHMLKSEEKVIAICRQLKASKYINPIGGKELYSKKTFQLNGFNLCFIKTQDFQYKQQGEIFIPFLSIIDVIMFNSKDEVKKNVNFGYGLTY